jgi:mono/diheme cytochrome c family protein
MKTLTFLAVLLTGITAIAQQSTPPAASAANVENGKKLYLRDGCWECHGYAGQGGRDGARLADTALSAAQLTRYIRRPTGAMPAYIDKVMTDAQAADIWAYLKSMPTPQLAKDIPLLNELRGQ